MAWHNTLLTRSHTLQPNLPQNPPPCTALLQPTQKPEYCCRREHHIASETNSSQLYSLQHDALRSGFALHSEAGPHAGPSAVYEPQMPCLRKVFMECAVCPTRRARTRCDVFTMDASTPTTARNRAQTLMPGLRLRSATGRGGRERRRRSRRLHQGRKFVAPTSDNDLGLNKQVEALDLLKSLTGTAVAAKLGIGVSTLYS